MTWPYVTLTARDPNGNPGPAPAAHKAASTRRRAGDPVYLNELQTRIYFLSERDLDRVIEKRRLAHERKASTTTATPRLRRALAARSRR